MNYPDRASFRAYKILRWGFIAAPLIAGIDKFTNFLVEWHVYLSPFITGLVDPYIFMKIVGLIEIGAGLLVISNPRFGGYVIAVWLWGIIINLLMIPGYYDIALRDFGLSLGALALAMLAEDYGK
jgi:hypothetical protein